jgi:hypothetical protein
LRTPGSLRTVTSAELNPDRAASADPRVAGASPVQELDLNHDGTMDVTLYDLDGDGRVERSEMDFDSDGRVDAIYQAAAHPGEHAIMLRDDNHDGTFENVSMDADGDGTIDANGHTGAGQGFPEDFAFGSGQTASATQTMGAAGGTQTIGLLAGQESMGTAGTQGMGAAPGATASFGDAPEPSGIIELVTDLIDDLVLPDDPGPPDADTSEQDLPHGIPTHD